MKNVVSLAAARQQALTEIKEDGRPGITNAGAAAG
jgi:hypothetical protein